jgi:hypothetical protein
MSKLDRLFDLFQKYCARVHEHTSLILEDDESGSLKWWTAKDSLVEFDTLDDGIAWLLRLLVHEQS